MSTLTEISEFLQKGRCKTVCELIEKAIDEGSPTDEIMDSLLGGMSVVGEKFKNNEVFVPEVLIAARAMNKGMELLKPRLLAEGIKSKGTACVGTVRGDLHDIGKNLVVLMLESKGFNVVDLGVDVSPEQFVQAAIENNCDVICCSALLTTTMGAMKEVVEEAKRAGIRDKVKILVGGAPVSQAFCDQIGADAYTPDAASASDVAASFVR